MCIVVSRMTGPLTILADAPSQQLASLVTEVPRFRCCCALINLETRSVKRCDSAQLQSRVESQDNVSIHLSCIDLIYSEFINSFMGIYWNVKSCINNKKEALFYCFSYSMVFFPVFFSIIKCFEVCSLIQQKNESYPIVLKSVPPRTQHKLAVWSSVPLSISFEVRAPKIEFTFS